MLIPLLRASSEHLHLIACRVAQYNHLIDFCSFSYNHVFANGQSSVLPMFSITSYTCWTWHLTANRMKLNLGAK